VRDAGHQVRSGGDAGEAALEVADGELVDLPDRELGDEARVHGGSGRGVVDGLHVLAPPTLDEGSAGVVSAATVDLRAGATVGEEAQAVVIRRLTSDAQGLGVGGVDGKTLRGTDPESGLAAPERGPSGGLDGPALMVEDRQHAGVLRGGVHHAAELASGETRADVGRIVAGVDVLDTSGDATGTITDRGDEVHGVGHGWLRGSRRGKEEGFGKGRP